MSGRKVQPGFAGGLSATTVLMVHGDRLDLLRALGRRRGSGVCTGAAKAHPSARMRRSRAAWLALREDTVSTRDLPNCAGGRSARGNEPRRSCDGVGSLPLGHRLPGVVGGCLGGEQYDNVVVRTGRDHADGRGAGGIRGGDTCQSRRRGGCRGIHPAACRTLPELDAWWRRAQALKVTSGVRPGRVRAPPGWRR